jgi:hypothetical protein
MNALTRRDDFSAWRFDICLTASPESARRVDHRLRFGEKNLPGNFIRDRDAVNFPFSSVLNEKARA